MTLDEKIGQMMQPDQSALKNPSEIETYFLGSLLSGGGSGPKNKDGYTLKGWTDMVDGYQQHALRRKRSASSITTLRTNRAGQCSRYR